MNFHEKTIGILENVDELITAFANGKIFPNYKKINNGKV
jgi:hypothetical protein